VLYFVGFNMHYRNSRLKFSFRISTKCVRGLLSSLLNAFHCITSWRNTVRPCQNFCHHTSRQVRFCTFVLPCVHSFFCHFLRQQRECKQAQAHSFCCVCACALIFSHSPSVKHRHVQRFLVHHVKQYPVPFQHNFSVHVVCWWSATCP
jgi:hypothetical protein